MPIKQSINLFQFEAKKRDPWYLRASFFFSVNYALLFLAVISSLWAYYEKTISEFAYFNQKKSEGILQLKVEKRRLELRALQSNTQVVQDLTEARQEYDQKNRLLNFLKNQNKPILYSEFLDNLDSAHLPSMQLNFITIENYGESIDIKGLAKKSASVAQWLSLLKKTPSFQGKNFEKIVIEKDQNSPYVTFEVVGQYD